MLDLLHLVDVIRHKLQNGHTICSKKCDKQQWRSFCQELRKIGIDPDTPTRSVNTQNYNALINWISERDVNMKHVPDKQPFWHSIRGKPWNPRPELCITFQEGMRDIAWEIDYDRQEGLNLNKFRSPVMD